MVSGFVGPYCLDLLVRVAREQLASQLEPARYTNKKKILLGSLVNCNELSELTSYATSICPALRVGSGDATAPSGS